jgi:hypothetical protein
MTAGINNFKSGITETAGENAGAAVVAVKAGFGNHHANFSFRHMNLLKANLIPMALATGSIQLAGITALRF